MTKSEVREILRSALAAMLAASLVWGGVPTQAWAEGFDELAASGAENVAQDDDSQDDAEESPQDGAAVDQVVLDEATANTSDADSELSSESVDADAGADADIDEGAPVSAEAETTEDAEGEGLSLTAASVDDDMIAEGVWGTCNWSIDGDGYLEIWPVSGGSGELDASRGYRSAESESYFPWYQYRSSIKSVTIAGNVSLRGSGEGFLRGCSNLIEADLSDLNVSLTNMSYMFSDCSNLVSLDLSGWDTSSVTGMSYMFFGCSKLASLDPSGWDTSSVTDMSGMFDGCSSLASLDLSGWDTSGVSDMESMFDGCSSLRYFAVDGFRPTYGSYSFPECTGGWWSSADQAWYTVDEIKANRSGMADVYTDGTVTAVTSSAIQLAEEGFVYDGTAKMPAVTVTLAGTVLNEGTDYTVTYHDNTKAGAATVTVHMIGEYYGKASKTFEIALRPVEVRAIDVSKLYGEEDPEFTAVVDGVIDGDSIAYELYRDEGEDLGTYSIHAIGRKKQGNYSVTYTAGTLTIAPFISKTDIGAIERCYGQCAAV